MIFILYYLPQIWASLVKVAWFSMEITKKKNIAQELAANIDPHNLSYKAPGINAWLLLITFCVLAFYVPPVALLIARLMALYTVLRFIVVAAYYLISLNKVRRTEAYLRSHSAYENLTAKQKARCAEIHHVVVIPNYKEPAEVLERTLTALARSPMAQTQITVVLAMEESETEAHTKAQQLVTRFEKSFAHLFATYHPAQISGEIPGKAANQSWGARQAKIELVDRLGLSLDDLTVTSCDADSILHPEYFSLITREFVCSQSPHHTIWQSPLLYDINIWQAPASIRLLTFFNNAIQVSELANPFSMAFPLSTYTFSFRLLTDVEYWDPAVISEDWHMFLRCFFARAGKMQVDPIYLPTIGEPVLGENTWKAWENFYKQQLRHAWGACDMSYMLQQWNRHPGTPFYKKLGRFTKIWHDNMVFSTGAILILLGTVLSIVLENNPVVTIPRNSVFTPLTEIINAVGVLGMLTIWITERIRCANRNFTWKLTTILAEIINWVIFAAVTFVLAGVPVIQAQTMMLFGANLAYERTPKGIHPKK
jgi:cellulose synthase/poly-beta-1,6-N-acetylglucosamine synthase-like glycosyltransferase